VSRPVQILDDEAIERALATLRTRRRLSAHVTVEPYPWGLVRLRIERLEVTAIREEVPLLVDWGTVIASLRAELARPALPVPEYWRAPWNADYRWTAAANDQYAREWRRRRRAA
jgi:hypothetical protein